jgi:hypothetical protein
MTDLSRFFPKEHPNKIVFHRAGIPVAAVAKFLGLSTSYTCSMLNGFARITSDNERKLNELVRLVQEGEKNKA